MPLLVISQIDVYVYGINLYFSFLGTHEFCFVCNLCFFSVSEDILGLYVNEHAFNQYSNRISHIRGLV